MQAIEETHGLESSRGPRKASQRDEGTRSSLGLKGPVPDESSGEWEGAAKSSQDRPTAAATGDVETTVKVADSHENVAPEASSEDSKLSPKEDSVTSKEVSSLSGNPQAHHERVARGGEEGFDDAEGTTMNLQGDREKLENMKEHDTAEGKSTFSRMPDEEEKKSAGAGILVPGLISDLVVNTLLPLATVVGEGASVLLGRGHDGGPKREGANVEVMRTLENVSSPTIPQGKPLLERVVHLEQQMTTLEVTYSPRAQADAQLHSPVSPSSLIRSSTTSSSLETRCRPAKSVLEETEAKGTLVERVQMLEKRLGQVSPKAVPISEDTETAAEEKPAAKAASNVDMPQDHTIEKADPTTEPSNTHTDAVTEEVLPSEPSEDESTKPLLGSVSNESVSTKEAEEATQESIPEETLASEASTQAPAAVPAEAIEREEVGKSETAAAAAPEEPALAPTAEQPQKTETLQGGGVEKPAVESAAKPGEPSPLAHKEVEQKPAEESKAPAAASAQKPDYVTKPQPLAKNEKKKKRRFKGVRQMCQRLFRSKQDAS